VDDTCPNNFDLARPPTAHVHVRLDGAMRPATLAELAERAGLPVPASRGYGAFDAFGARIRTAAAVVRTEDDLARLVLAVAGVATSRDDAHLPTPRGRVSIPLAGPSIARAGPSSEAPPGATRRSAPGGTLAP